MNSFPWLEIVTGLATIVTTVATVISGNKMIMYRIQQLENKVAEYNNLKLRMLSAEKDIEVLKHENKII
mgnify:FL=1